MANDKKYGDCEIMCFRKQNSLEGRITSRFRSATECSMFAVFQKFISKIFERIKNLNNLNSFFLKLFVTWMLPLLNVYKFACLLKVND